MQELRRDRDNAKVIRTLTKSMYFNPTDYFAFALPYPTLSPLVSNCYKEENCTVMQHG
jgi:hypothetical protein